MKKGFTLVELSIVLVIIGLLISGILVAQSLITTARISAQVRQIQQMDIAISNFKLKFDSVPGDSSLFPGDGDDLNCASGVEGNDDGIIDSVADGNGFTCEVDDFWPALQKSGFNQDGKTYSHYTSGPIETDVHLPAAKLGPSGTNIGVSSVISGWTWFRDWCAPGAYNIGTGYGVTSDSGASIPGDQALALDTKLDDGKGKYSGNMWAFCVGGEEYSQAECLKKPTKVYIKILATTGLPSQ